MITPNRLDDNAALHGTHGDADALEYPAQSVSPALIERLYAVAEAMERRWAAAGLPDTLGSRMVAAALRCLDKRGYRLDPKTQEEADALQTAALHVLRIFFRRNARRDAARTAQARQSGKQPCASLDTLPGESWHPSDNLYAGDLRGGETGRAVVAFLMRELEYPPARAWAFVLRAGERPWDDVAFLLGEMGYPVAPERLRQWQTRHFPQAAALLRQRFLSAQPMETSLARRTRNGSWSSCT